MLSGENSIGSYYSVGVISLSTVLFFALNLLLNRHVPRSAKSGWKYKNIFLSFVHAVISGTGALYCLVNLPEMAEDVINVYNKTSYTLVCFTLGYILYDSLDMLYFHPKRESFELLGHHVIIVICFGISIVYHTYIGYAVVALIAELNSIFLHIRQLMLICRCDKSNSIYRLNSLANIGTFITFRIMTFGWMTRWLFLNKDLVPLTFFTVGSIGLAIITVMNIILFYRLLKADFFRTLPGDNKIE